MITLDLSILNQKGTPMFYSDFTANRPAAGIAGRIFIATDSPYGLFRDTGSAWEQIAAGGGTSGITGSGTATQVAFFDGASNIISDADLYWDNTNKRLGVGTNSPTNKLTISGSGTLAAINGTATNNSFIGFDLVGVNKWRIGNAYQLGANYFQLYDNFSSIERLRWDNTGQAQFQGYFDFLASTTNDVATFRASQANVTIKATGATNPVSLTFDPSATYESVIQAINTGGYFQFKTNGLVRNQVLNDGKNTINSTPIISSSDGWYSINTQAISTIPASTSFGNLGYVMGSIAGLNLMTYAGSATYAQANVAASIVGLNSFTFSAGASTITMNQATGGIRAYTGITAQNQFTGSQNGTISHLAGIQTLGIYNNNDGLITPTITNYYGLLVNSSTEYGHTLSITNKYGIYQDGSNDANYFAGSVAIGKTGDTGLKLSVIGTATFSSSVTANSFVKTSGTSAQILAADGSVITAGTNITISGGTISASGGGGSMAIGGSITGATAGSVLFAGTSGVLAQRNANFFWDNTNFRLGIGTTTPATELHIVGNITIANSTQSTLISNKWGAGSQGNNIFIGGGGQSITGTSFAFSSRNVSVGVLSLNALTTGYYNTAIGYQSLQLATTGFYNTAIGYAALSTLTTGDGNVAIGYTTLQNNNSGANVGVGNAALFANTTGNYNVAVGVQSLTANIGGIYNTGIGSQSLFSNTSGNNNTAIGLQSGWAASANANTTGSNNIFIGYQSVGVSPTDSNRTWIGNGSTTSTWLAGNLLVGSTTDTGQKVQISGAIRINGQSAVTAGGSAGLHLIVNIDGTNYKIALLNV